MSRRALRTAVALTLLTVALSLTAPPAALAASPGGSVPGLAQLVEWVQDIWGHLTNNPVPPSTPTAPQEQEGASPGRGGNGPIDHVSGRGGTIDPNGVNLTEHSDP